MEESYLILLGYFSFFFVIKKIYFYEKNKIYLKCFDENKYVYYFDKYLENN